MPDETTPIEDALAARDARIRALETTAEGHRLEIEALWAVIHDWAGVIADLTVAQ